MLSVFPDLYTYQQLAPFLLRVTAGLLFLLYAVRVFHGIYAARIQPRFFGSERSGRLAHQVIAFISGVGGVLLVVGLYMQVAALVLAIISAGRIGYLIGTKNAGNEMVAYRVTLLVILVSLLFLGPGFWAFDYPL